MAGVLIGGSGSTRGSRRSRRLRRAPMAEINVTPLVDVMLVLLVIFMVTAPLLKAGIPIDLPSSQAKLLDQQPHQVTVTLSRDGVITLDDTRLTQEELVQHIASMPPGADGQLPLVSLRADTSLDYGRVIAVMGALNHAGITRISLVTRALGAAPNSAGSGGRR